MDFFFEIACHLFFYSDLYFFYRHFFHFFPDFKKFLEFSMAAEKKVFVIFDHQEQRHDQPWPSYHIEVPRRLDAILERLNVWGEMSKKFGFLGGKAGKKIN